jgi:hypothetical protein
MDDLSIDDLLLAASKLQRSYIEPKQEIEWIRSPSTITCLQCNHIYHGQKRHPSISPPKPSFVAWCPKCLDSKVFWLHQDFEVESIRNLNGKGE